MNFTVENIIKVILSVLFFVCLLNMPYVYFQLVRFVALVGFAILAYKAQIWDIVDVVVGEALLVSLFMRPSNSPRKSKLICKAPPVSFGRTERRKNSHTIQ